MTKGEFIGQSHRMIIVIDVKLVTLNDLRFPYSYGLHSHADHVGHGYIDLKTTKP